MVVTTKLERTVPAMAGTAAPNAHGFAQWPFEGEFSPQNPVETGHAAAGSPEACISACERVGMKLMTSADAVMRMHRGSRALLSSSATALGGARRVAGKEAG